MRVLVVTAMYPTEANPASGSFIKTQVMALNQLGHEVEPLVIEGPDSRLKYLDGLRRLWKRLRRGDVDVVHANYVFSAIVARLQASAPLVVTYNGSDLLGPVEHSDGRHTFTGDVSVAASKLIARVADAVIVPSEEMARRLSFKEAVHVIGHGLDMSLFAPHDRHEARERLGMDPHRPYLLFAADPKRNVKNYPLAAVATERVRSVHADVELVAVHREPQERLALLMSACDALVFPSFQEGSPNVVKQAMACNLPIVSGDVGDVREVVGDTRDCHIVPLRADAFANALVEVLNHRRRTEGRARVARFDHVAVARRVAGVYEQVASRRRASGAA